MPDLAEEKGVRDMICPACGSDNSSCLDSRQVGVRRRRRYKCHNCEARFTTWEIPAARLEAARELIMKATHEISSFSETR